jgi:hypothetical protein
VAFLNSLGASLGDYGGWFSALFEDCGYDARKIISRLVAEFPAYGSDRWIHPISKNLLIFDKRARLLPTIYEGRARDSHGALPTLSNLEAIGPILDYQVPRILRAKGVFVYEQHLGAAVDNGELLTPGSAEELAIRSVTGMVVSGLLSKLQRIKGKEAISMVELDYALWSSGRKASGRHHLTLTTAY